MFRRLATHLRSLALPAGLLVLALLLLGSPLYAQQPDRRAPDRPLPERLAPDRGEARASSERGRIRAEALTRRRAQPFTPASLTNTPANLFTRAGAGLTGVQEGSSTLGDVDGDGTLDLVITGADGRNETSTLYLGVGSGGFGEANARGPDLRR